MTFRVLVTIAFGVCLFMPDIGSAEDSRLSSSIKDYLRITHDDRVGEGDFIASSGRVFEQFLRADEHERISGVRELLTAYVSADGLKQTMIPYVMLCRLPISKDELAIAAAEHLFHSDVEIARKWARVLSDRLGSESLSGYVDIRDIEMRWAAMPSDAQKQTIARYLFQKSPSSTLLLLARQIVPGSEERRLRIADRRIATELLAQMELAENERGKPVEAIAVLAKLARHDQPWVRTYVVEMMIQNPMLRDDQVIDLLSSDGDELVAAAIRDLRDPGKQARHKAIRTPWMEL